MSEELHNCDCNQNSDTGDEQQNSNDHIAYISGGQGSPPSYQEVMDLPPSYSIDVIQEADSGPKEGELVNRTCVSPVGPSFGNHESEMGAAVSHSGQRAASACCVNVGSPFGHRTLLHDIDGSTYWGNKTMTQ